MTIKVGIIGAGNISETHARAAAEIQGVRVAAVTGGNPDKARALAQRFDATAYASVDAMLEREPLDLVAIGSPSGLHAEQGIAAARRGVHVLVEKPIDITVERADALIDACDRAGVTLGVFFQDRFKPDLERLRALILGGRLGRPLIVDAHLPWYRRPEYYSGSKWRGTWALDGGGALMNQGIHTVDLLLWLLGDVTAVQARTATVCHEIEVEDTALAVLEFQCGAVGTLNVTTAAFPGALRRLVLTGTEGTAVVEQDRLVSIDVRHPDAETVVAPPQADLTSASSPVVADISAHRAVFVDLLDAIAHGRPPRCDGREGRRSVALVRAIYDASQKAHPHVVDPA